MALQVRDQVDVELFEPQHLTEQTPESWIAANLPKGGRLGYDPWLHTPEGVKRLRQAAASSPQYRPSAPSASGGDPPQIRIRLGIKHADAWVGLSP